MYGGKLQPNHGHTFVNTFFNPFSMSLPMLAALTVTKRA